MTKILSVLLVGVLAVFLTVSTLHAENLVDMAPGTKLSGFVKFGKKQIALPAGGEWEVVFAETGIQASGGTGRLRSGKTFLEQKTEDGKVLAFLVARTNLDSPVRGWRQPKSACNRKDVHHDDSNAYARQGDCWSVTHYVTRPSKDSFWNKIFRYTKNTAGTVHYIGNSYWRNDVSHYVRLAYYVNPMAYGFSDSEGQSKRDSDWHRDKVPTMPPEYQAFVDAVKAFGEQYREAFRAGFKNKLGAVAPGLKFVYPE